MIAVILIGCGIAYQILTIIAALRFRRPVRVPDFHPAVSILKPVRGRAPGFYEAICSHAMQQYPQFEILFGVSDPKDAALEDIDRLRAEFPLLTIRIVSTANDAPNGKVGSLEVLAGEAAYETLVVNDGDIVAPPGYLADVVGPLADDSVGLVTCLYRGKGESIAAKAEALGIATEFVPSVLVARLLSSSGFALGSTMAFRKRELDAIGGFAVLREYLADDYQLGARISALGKRVVLSQALVETRLGAGNWTSVWKHQLRWSRTIRVSRPAGYFGYAVTQITFWCLLAALSGDYTAAVAGLTVRLLAACFYTRQLLWVPLRDLFGFAVWCGGLFGNTVEWGGLRYRLFRDGRIELRRPE